MHQQIVIFLPLCFCLAFDMLWKSNLHWKIIRNCTFRNVFSMCGIYFPIITEMDLMTKVLTITTEHVLKWWKQWHPFESYWYTFRFGFPLEFHLLFLLHSFSFLHSFDSIFTSNPLYTLQIFNFQCRHIIDSARTDWKEFHVSHSLDLSWDSTGCQRNHQTHYTTMANSNASIHAFIKLFPLCSSFQHFHSFHRLHCYTYFVGGADGDGCGDGDDSGSWVASGVLCVYVCLHGTSIIVCAEAFWYLQIRTRTATTGSIYRY